MRFLIILLLFAAVGVSVFYSHHGFKDMRSLQSKIDATRDRTKILEDQNQRLKYQVSVLEKPSAELLVRELRDFMGWVKPGELVYLEKSSAPAH